MSIAIPKYVTNFRTDMDNPDPHDETPVDLRFGRVAAVTSGTVGGEHHTVQRNANALRLRKDLEHGATIADDLLLDDPQFPTYVVDVARLCYLVKAMNDLLKNA